LNSELFAGKLRFQVLVLPPEEGSFLTRLRIVLFAGAGVVWFFAESDIGKAFIKGLTDHEPAYWAEIAGKAINAGIAEKAEANDLDVPHASSGVECETLIIGQMAQSFLQKELSELEGVGMSTVRFRAAYEAKNIFYDACKATEGLKAIGFSEEPVFPIQRESFSRLQTILPPRTEDPEHPWFVDTVALQVTSPNWDRDDRLRYWKGYDTQKRDRLFRIEDEDFWGRVRDGTIKAHIIDQMRVQWAFQGRSEQPKNCRVLRVLEFNGVELAEPLGSEALRAQLGQVGRIVTEQGWLFN